MPSIAFAPTPQHTHSSLAQQQAGGKAQTNVNSSAMSQATSSASDAFADSMNGLSDEDIKSFFGDCEANSASEELLEHVQNLLNLLRQKICGNNYQDDSQKGQQQTETTEQTVTASCDSAEASGGDISTLSSLQILEQNRTKWQQNSANTYAFSLIQRNAQGSTTTPVTVNNGRVSSGGSNALTIEQIFDLARNASLRNERADIIYHPRLGFPEFIFLGYDRETSDDNVSYILSNLTIG
ncbi:MAG: hypothetical protein CR991_07870 [Proteobacteria bacterium]|nr:MAG: hypothetical protein CR991_07870 [Pseudomonadota bacterium]